VSARTGSACRSDKARPRWGAVLSVQVTAILWPDGGLLRVLQAARLQPSSASQRSRSSGGFRLAVRQIVTNQVTWLLVTLAMADDR
jgi:hypothetical protein